MKPSNFIRAIVITADQRGSRRGRDAVPVALRQLGAIDPDAAILPFERTVGDELQGVAASGSRAVAAVRELVRLGGWRIGLGVGAVELPLPASTRAARGPAFIAARTAVEAARRSPVDLALRVAPAAPDPVGADVVGGGGYGIDVVAGAASAQTSETVDAELAESALWLLTGLWRQRSEEGWIVVEARTAGATGRAIAGRLGISDSAVSQRLRRAGYEEGLRGASLCATLIDRCLRP